MGGLFVYKSLFMQKNLLSFFLILFLFCFTKVTAQVSEKIHTIEYFFDTDPGFGNGSTITVTPAATVVSSLSFTPNISALSNGLHVLYVRTIDSNYRKSLSIPRLFYKENIVANTGVNATAAEYFFDVDPGFGNGTAAAVTPGGIVSFVFNGNIASLSTGLHMLYVRVKDALGNWSLTKQSVFYREAVVTNPAQNITAAEYFFDTDPGFGSATPTPVVAGQLISFNISGDISPLTNGLHYLFVRTRAADGKWSETIAQLFYKEPAVSSTIPNVVAAEYFFDTDLGFGNGTPYVFAVPGTNVSQMINVSTTGLTKGFHRLFMRAKDANGNWSLINSPVFYYETIVVTPPVNEMLFLEWFWNTDPGFGNANRVSLPAGNAGQITNFVFNPGGISGFSNTRQNLYMRMINDNWSETTVRMVDFTGVLLPVTLLEFTARAKTNTVLTKWITTQELNTDRFEVEHSIDGIHFEKFGSIKAAGNSNVQKDYLLEHLKPSQGLNFYRLKQIDVDGSFTYSGIVKVIFNNGKSGPVAFPNPVVDKLTVMIPMQMSNNNKLTINVFDSKGAAMYKKQATGVTNYIDFSGYANGNYFIVVSDETGNAVWKETIIKAK